ncbi:MAG: MmgE/PrpD family protein [Acidobacteria bacterium]|nr:MmgE/PrpD family protein [Acidobacteriota bacterium]
MPPTISRRWADYALGLRFEDLPGEAVAAAKLLLVDSLACGLGGSRTEDHRILCDVLAQLGSKPECTVIGTALKTSCRDASLANSLAIRAMDYNDVYWKQDPCHPSDLLPAALSLGERGHRSGRELLVAMIIAYELEMRICEAAVPGIRELGWHHATLTQFVSPVVAGRMLGLNHDQLINAIGISASHNGTLGAVTAGKLTMMKNTVDPMATESGVMAALLAARGYRGPEEIFEGREGLFMSLGREWDAARLTEDLGEGFRIMRCSIKPYPSEALTHTPISAVLDLVMEFDLAPEQIERIQVWTLRRAAEILADPTKYEVSSRETADHSLPYCMAAAVVDHELTERQFLPDRLRDVRIHRLMQKVAAMPEPAFETRFPAEQPCRVELLLNDGRTLVKQRDYPKGDPRDPPTERDMELKLASLAEGVITRERQARMVQVVARLESLADIGDLMSGLSANPVHPQSGVEGGSN